MHGPYIATLCMLSKFRFFYFSGILTADNSRNIQSVEVGEGNDAEYESSGSEYHPGEDLYSSDTDTASVEQYREGDDADAQRTDDAVVDAQPTDDAVVDAQRTDNAVVDAQPTDDAVVDAQRTDNAVVDAQPTNDAVVDAQRTDDAVVDAQPTDDAVVDAQRTDDAVVDAQPTDAAVVDAQPTDDAVVDAQRTDDAVVDAQRTDNAVVDAQRTDDAVVDAQPPPKRRRTEAEKCVYNQAKYPMLPPCGATCKRKCVAKVTEIKRSAIHAQFWIMPYNQRRMWIHYHVKKIHTKRPRKETSGAHDKSFSRLYTLPGEDGIEVSVCKIFFLRTLGLRSDKVITTALTGTPDDAIVPAMDRRGSHEPKNKLSDECVQALHQHVESFHPAISHYRREHAPLRRYLPPELSIREMHTNFNEASAKAGKSGVSYQRYRRVVADMNIGFTKLGEEECEICNLNDKHANDNTDDTAECTLCKSWQQHIENATLSRERYRLDSENNRYSNNEAHFSVDMQKVIMLPRLPGNKTAIFTRRLVLFHETFAPLGRSSKDHPVVGIL